MKKIIFISISLFFCNFLSAQNITNTLGSNGVFSIKSGATNYLTLSQTNGNTIFLRNIDIGNQLNSSFTVGVITKGGTRFLHNFAPAGADGNNTFLGLSSGNFTMIGTSTSASYNTGVGAFTLFSLTDGHENTAVGNNALYSNTFGNRNNAMGYLALSSNTSGSNNVAIGNISLASNTNGYDNIGIGYSSLHLNAYGNSNIALGTYSLTSNVTGNNNIAIGQVSLGSNTSGSNNNSIGDGSMELNTTGSENVALGDQSLYNNTTADYNVGIGYGALRSNSTGFSNTAVGSRSMYYTTGNSNTSLGYYSLNTNSTGSENTAIGTNSLLLNTAGYDNTALGMYSLNSNTTGNLNTALGFSTGSTITTGSNLTLVGYNAEPTSPTATNQITLGNASVTSLRCNVTAISSLSDMRDKKNIMDLSLGLKFLMNLKPREFNWDKREWYEDNKSDGSKMQETKTAGFIAQELDEVQTKENADWLNLVLKDNPEKWEATYGNLLPVMVKSIQELKTENDELKSRIEQLEKMVTTNTQYTNNK